MEKNVTDEQRASELVDTCQRTVHHSLEDIRKAIAILENSIETGNGREELAKNIEAVHNILGEVCSGFQDLDRQIQSLSGDRPLTTTQPNPTEKIHLKNLLSNWFSKNDLDKTA